MIVRNAIERYRSQDFISCVSILETRIEGVLRSHKTIVEPLTKAGQATLANAVAVSHSNDDMSLLLPHRFSEYLKQVYFANFNPTHSTIDISRNAVGHGVANESAFNKKAAVRAILVLHQLFYTFGTYGGDSNKEPANDESTDQ